MTALNKGVSSEQLKQMLLLLALIAAGLVGNHFQFTIVNAKFVFGSIFAMLALQYFGLGLGILAAVIISGYTYFLWNHPYAIITMTTEVAVVGYLMARHKMEMVLADAIYWIIIGIPLGYFCFYFISTMPSNIAIFLMVKQTINGISNALIARLIFTGFALRSRSSLISYRELLYNLLAFFVLCPALIILVISSRIDFSETDQSIRSTLSQDSQRVAERLKTWVLNRKSGIITLAEMAVSRSPQQMQPYLELAKKADINFLRVGLLNREAITTAFTPLVDELGQKNVGKNFADRPFIPILKQTLKPMLSEVVMGRIGTPKPVVSVLAPVVIRGEYSGYVIGVLDMEQIRDYLDLSVHRYASLFTLLDKNNNIIMTNRSDQKVMTPFTRGKGAINHLDNRISQFVPALPPNTSTIDLWGKSSYIAEVAVGDLSEWRLILEQPVAPFQKTLYHNYTEELILLFLILAGGLALAQLSSRWSVETLERLRLVTLDLPVKLATDKKVIDWPESNIKEANHLINNFREMADFLSKQFNEVRQINESLEQRVEERTEQLFRTNEKLNNEIDEREQAEEQILRSLKEKEVMLKEIHHRVKNNMQVIYSLLNLQAKGITDSAVRAMFEEARNRVHSMALIHERLYGSKDLAHIDFKEYLTSLVAGIAETYKRHDVVLSVDMEPVTLDVNVGIPCGLIVNELVSNCLKYAFPEGRKGTIKVGISKDSEGNNVLIVADNGIGFPETVDFRNTVSLGLQLVTGLTKQIHGTIELTKAEGTTFRITFPGGNSITVY
jgi:two-component sensor histidine kinase